jgi:16S rRNA (guanine527-N7)-methyltransferase
LVPRETAPKPPPAADRVFGDTLADARRYAELLAGEAVARGLLGPREVPRLWERHLLNCAVAAPAVTAGASVCDLGSGAGLPGIVWALLRPDLHMTLLEPMQRRVDFLSEAVGALGLRHVGVVRARADGQARPVSVDVVAARAVAPLRRLAAWALPLVHPGGELLALKGATATAELAAAEPALRRLGAVHWTVERWGASLVDPPTILIRVTAGGRER